MFVAECRQGQGFVSIPSASIPSARLVRTGPNARCTSRFTAPNGTTYETWESLYVRYHIVTRNGVDHLTVADGIIDVFGVQEVEEAPF